MQNLVESLPRDCGPVSMGRATMTLSRAKIMSIWDSVVDPHHLDADPDSTYPPDADTDADFYFVRIRMRTWIRPFTRIRIQILASNKGSNPWKSAKIGSYLINFGPSSANWCGFGSTKLIWEILRNLTMAGQLHWSTFALILTTYRYRQNKILHKWIFVSRQYEQLAQQKEKSRLINQEGASQESLRYSHGPLPPPPPPPPTPFPPSQESLGYLHGPFTSPSYFSFVRQMGLDWSRFDQ